jgi:hypothetical protein
MFNLGQDITNKKRLGVQFLQCEELKKLGKALRFLSLTVQSLNRIFDITILLRFSHNDYSLRYGERLAYLQSLSLPPHAKVVEAVVCKSKEHQKSFHAEIMKKGGKGISMKSPVRNRVYCKQP